ncbi:MAG: SET domain-containing protein-lysine N-methyltransferase [Muricomes sp.]
MPGDPVYSAARPKDLFPMMLVPTYLEKSAIHGFGVFAKEPIPQGARVWEFHPKLDIKFSPEEFDALPPSVKEELEHHMYEPEEGGHYYYEATMGKYMNHSREPNVDFSAVGYGVATRDIQGGEELTCDYRDFMASWDHIPYI